MSDSFVQGLHNYTLLWCNHFWQKDSFFTMEHVSRLSFCFCYTTHFFMWSITDEKLNRSIDVPTSKILSEEKGRDWRHKVTQRCLALAFYKNQNKASLFVRKIKFKYIDIAPFNYYKSPNKALCSGHYEQLCVQGHNKSDRAEAILFNLIRGTGINGVSTLQWKHAFLLLSSNHKFYPVFFGFLKKNMDYMSKFVFFCTVEQNSNP